MKHNFKKLNTITEIIKRKIYSKNDTRFVLISENWKFIVGNDFYEKSNPLKITKEHKLKVEVAEELLVEFTFSNQKFLKKINQIIGVNKNIVKILVVQKHF